MESSIILYRKRHIPQECFRMDKDEVVYLDDSTLVTRWKTIKPHPDFASGISFHDFNNHWKISRLAKKDGSLYYWYCDIVNVTIDKMASSYTIEDLLVDIVVFPDGTVRVVDLDELAQAFDKGLISGKLLSTALKSADALLRLIQNGGFKKYQERIESFL